MGFQFSCPPYSADRKGRRKHKYLGRKKSSLNWVFPFPSPPSFPNRNWIKTHPLNWVFYIWLAPFYYKWKKRKNPKTQVWKYLHIHVWVKEIRRESTLAAILEGSGLGWTDCWRLWTYFWTFLLLFLFLRPKVLSSTTFCFFATSDFDCCFGGISLCLRYYYCCW